MEKGVASDTYGISASRRGWPVKPHLLDVFLVSCPIISLDHPELNEITLSSRGSCSGNRPALKTGYIYYLLKDTNMSYFERVCYHDFITIYGKMLVASKK